ncbi:MarR family transcriptional regulator [Streptomyces sp. NPDC050507]|uniref:MarR family transcriptional regulator n=1 Tax=Streptomyces sp. NPDC050507 TaxID=3365619 RepID=UPI00379D20B3
MARLNPEPLGTDELHAVLSVPDLLATAKTIWVYLRIASDPQSQKAIAEALSIDPSTVARLVKALEAKGLARKVHGVWLPEVPR